MHLIPIRTPVIHQGDDLADVLVKQTTFLPGDILVISSKVMATAEGSAVDLHSLSISAEANEWSEKTGCDAAFIQGVLNETARLHGTVKGYCKGALLAEVRPDGMKIGMIFAPNAGMDASNIAKGYAVGWPVDPVNSMKKLQKSLRKYMQLREQEATSYEKDSKLEARSSKLAILISDSCCRPRRLGVTAFALTCCGIDPLRSEIGNTDLFGKKMTLTVESTADQLATAANMLMGNVAQSTPAVIIRDHGIPFSNFCGWVDGMREEEDLFSAIL